MFLLIFAGQTRGEAVLSSRTTFDPLAGVIDNPDTIREQEHTEEALIKYDEALKCAPNSAALKQARHDGAAAELIFRAKSPRSR
jgi:hypothetical protein